MKVKDVNEIYNRLIKLKDKKMPAYISFKVVRNIKKMEEIVSPAEEQRINLITVFADKDVNGEVITDESGKATIKDIPGFMNELNKLYESDVDVEFEKISEEDIIASNTEQYDILTVDDIDALAFMIEE